ncbi:MAG TPA: methylmalonyl-CoA epimerase [Candidatus Limnocylindrales bacterium]|nr:methylmalonyl-CoA epimerase [Candidatus Limnocylindrales bacterium]
MSRAELSLAPGAPGGVKAAPMPDEIDPTIARVVHLRGPASKGELLDRLARGLAFPTWFGRNWDALEELLRSPVPPDDRAIVLVWHDPDRLPSPDRELAEAVFEAVAEARARTGSRPLHVRIQPRSAPQKEPAMTEHTKRVPEAIRRLGKVHHVALIVRSIDGALALWRDQLGLELETVMDIPQDRVRIAFLGVGESKIELVEPTDDTTGVARFLASKGEGFHHVCFEVENLAETLLRLEIDGLELIDTAPRRGAEGPVAFLHPRSGHGVLIELIEAPGGPAWSALGFDASP